jgi:hypothetical protein
MWTIETTGRFGSVLDPFPGLRPFETNEDVIFRGRQLHTDELLRRLAIHRFLAVVGTSGSGKSSLVRAGLLPALDRGHLAGATSRWRIAVMRPGMAPLQNLSEALRGSDALRSVDEGQLRSTTMGLVDVARAAKLDPGESLLVVVDQFEEIFRYEQRRMNVDGGAEAALFVRLLLTASQRPDAPVYVVLTMRSDFLGDCSQFAGLPEALSESQYLIPRLTREQRRQAIEEPLRLFGAAMTPQLVEQLLNDSGTAEAFDGLELRGTVPDPLPVLQHALMRTYVYWKSLPVDRRGDKIDLPHYQAAGRIEAAIDRHAEALFNEALPDDGARRWAERIFRCLTTTEVGRPVRRPTPLEELYAVVGAGASDRDKVDETLAVFRRPDNFLISLSRDNVVDISHESVIWKWTRLGGWTKDEAASAELYTDLVKDSKRKATWSEPKLSSALRLRRDEWNPAWARQYSDGDFEGALAFLERSRRVVADQEWLRRVAVAAVFALIVFGVWSFYNMRELALSRTVSVRLQAALDAKDKEQIGLRTRIADLNELEKSAGLSELERKRILAEKNSLEDQYKQSIVEKSRLMREAEQATTLQASVQLLQDRLSEAEQALSKEAAGRRQVEARAAAAETRANEAEQAATTFEAAAKKLLTELATVKLELANAETGAAPSGASTETNLGFTNDAVELLRMLQRYRDGYQTLSAEAVRSVVPNIPVDALRSSFREHESWIREIRIDEMNISGSSAVIKALVSDTERVKSGKPLNARVSATFNARKAPDGAWIIERVEWDD